MIADQMIGRYCTLALSLFIPPLTMKNRPCALIRSCALNRTNTVISNVHITFFVLLKSNMLGESIFNSMHGLGLLILFFS